MWYGLCVLVLLPTAFGEKDEEPHYLMAFQVAGDAGKDRWVAGVDAIEALTQDF